MNETIPIEPAASADLHLTIMPWPSGISPPLSASRDVNSLAADGALRLSITVYEGHRSRLATLRNLLEAADTVVSGDGGIQVTLDFSGVVLTAGALATVLAEWSDDAVPVHELFGFDFAIEGGRGVPGCASRGLHLFVGQEVMCWPPTTSLRRVAARMTVRLANDLLREGPIRSVDFVEAPDAPGRRVALVPRTAPVPHVEIVFSSPN